MKKITKKEQVHIRVTKGQKDKITFLACTYAGGNISKYLIYAAMNAPRRVLK